LTSLGTHNLYPQKLIINKPLLLSFSHLQHFLYFSTFLIPARSLATMKGRLPALSATATFNLSKIMKHGDGALVLDCVSGENGKLLTLPPQ
jgi:hypothetical protein